MEPAFCHLLTGHDTVECAYYLVPNDVALIDYVALAVEKEDLRRSKQQNKLIRLGQEDFLFASHGTKSGYPFLIENDVFSIQFGEFNKPNFFVTFRSHALWHHGLIALHDRFMAWVESVGLRPYAVERVSRIDFAFDYQIPVIDFDEDNFVSRAAKDAQYRKNGKVQTFQFGRGDIALRVYDKCAEIVENGNKKTWLYDIWKTDSNVWRIEWQVRKQELRSMGIASIESVFARQGDLLKRLVNEHTTLRIKSNDSNNSRWDWHPLWQDLNDQIDNIVPWGTYREFDVTASMDEQLIRISISIYGYLKKMAAIYCHKERIKEYSVDLVLIHLAKRISKIHEPITWETDVTRRIKEMRVTEW